MQNVNSITFFKQPFAVSCDIIGITEEAETERNELALAAQAITSITTSQEQNRAVTVLRDVQTYINRVKATGLEYRRPANRMLEQICELEKDHLAPLIEAKENGSRLVTDFQQAEARRVAEEERKRSAEIARLEAERMAEEEAARAAERNIETEADLEAAIVQEQAAKASEAQIQARIAEPLPTPQKAKGAATRRVMRWEVVDIVALYKARPELVRLEPNASAILSTCVPELNVPGLRLWWEDKTSIRTW